jgi:ABC-type sugar transport system substrate-binding protein
MKKLLSLMLVLCFVLALAACSTTTTPADTASAAEETTVATTESTDATESTDTAATPKVALLMSKTTSAYSGAYFANFKTNADNYPDVEWIAFDAQNDPTLQAQQAEEALAMGASCIMMQPIDGTALIAAAKKITEAGIPLIVCNKKLATEGEEYFTSYFGPDLYEEGELAADLLHQKFPDGCTYVHLGQDPSDQTGRLRLSGFQDRAEQNDYKFELLGVSPSCDWSAEKGKSYMAAFLAKFSGQIDAVWAIDDAVGYGAFQAIQEDLSGENTGIQIVSVGGQEANLNAIAEGGNYLGTIYQSPKLVYDIVANNIMPTDKYIGMDLPMITVDNAADYAPAY